MITEIPIPPPLLSTSREIEEWLAILNREFGLQTTLRLRKKNLGHYNPKIDEINIGIQRDAPLNTFIHEYAHALDYSRGGRNHGPSFYRCLREVAARVLGCDDKYQWSREYRKIMKWAHRDGLLDEVPPPRPPRKVVNRQVAEPRAKTNRFGVLQDPSGFSGDENHAVVWDDPVLRRQRRMLEKRMNDAAQRLLMQKLIAREPGFPPFGYCHIENAIRELGLTMSLRTLRTHQITTVLIEGSIRVWKRDKPTDDVWLGTFEVKKPD